MIADCRFCKYFIPLDECDGEMLAKVFSLANARGEEPKGYCLRYKRGITYYVGHCKGFERKETEYKTIPLTKWMR